MPVHVTTLLHLDGAVRTLDLRFLAALELYMSLQVPHVYVALQALRAAVSFAELESVPMLARVQWLFFLVVEIFGLLQHHRAIALQTVLHFDFLHI